MYGYLPASATQSGGTRMTSFREEWRETAAPAAGGIALPPGVLAAAAADVAEGDLTVAQLADRLPASRAMAEAALEVVVGPDQRMNLPDAISRITVAARAVARVSTSIGAGTGFMIKPDLLMTNNHVFVGTDKRTATAGDADALVLFNYEQDMNGKLAPTKQYKTDPERFFTANLDLDYAVVAVEGNPGAEWGTLDLPAPDISVSVGDDVFIIEHPNGGPKQIAMAGNEVAYVDDKVIQYTTDTLPGASGAPVFDWTWRLIAVHHAGGSIVEPASGKVYYRNEGIRITAIASQLGLTANP